MIGRGSVSFDALRTLAERLPVALLPSWIETPSQPIAIDDVVRYLLGALDAPLRGSEVVEIGGADRVSYLGIVREIARQSGKRRLFLPVPTPRIPVPDALPLEALAPGRVRILRKLVESLRHDTTVRDGRAADLFASIRPLGLRAAVAAALA